MPAPSIVKALDGAASELSDLSLIRQVIVYEQPDGATVIEGSEIVFVVSVSKLKVVVLIDQALSVKVGVKLASLHVSENYTLKVC